MELPLPLHRESHPAAAPSIPSSGGPPSRNGSRIRKRRLISNVILPVTILCSAAVIYTDVGLSIQHSDHHQQQRRQLSDGYSTSTTTRSHALQYCLYIALSLGIFLHLTLLALIIKYHSSPSVKAAQPVGQAIITLGGAAALAGGICLVAPPTEVSCALIEPVIFVAITTMGASLAGMAWRVERVVAPILMLGRGSSFVGDNNEDGESFFGAFKRRHTVMLTLLAQKSLCRRKGGSPTLAANLSIGVRQKITDGYLIRLIWFLVLPQLALQIVDLALPSLRSQPTAGGICAHPDSVWPTALGTVLAVLPFFSAIVTTAKAEGSVAIPPVLCEARAIRKIVFRFTLLCATIAPILAFSGIDENVSIYISIYLLFVSVILVSYYVVWPKLSPIICSHMDFIDIEDQITSSARSLRQASEHIENDRRFEKAMDALDQGRIFEEMEMPNNSIKLYNEALEMWQGSKNDTRRHFTGDFTVEEIQDILSPTDADLIASLLISKAQYYEKITVLKAAKCYLKAIEVFEFAPAMESMSERLTIFPSFHSLFRLLREGKLERDFVFEKALSVRFVQETKRSNNYHHACALAMNAEMKYRSGLPNEALEEFNCMKKLYYVKDSKAIRDASGLDICLLASSRVAIWHNEMEDEESAVRQCESVIKMVQDIQSKDAREMHAVLTPIVAILRKKEPTRVKRLYNDHVVKHCRGSMPFSVRNMQLVLNLGSGGEIDSDVSWVLSNANTELKRSGDFINVTLGLSANTVAAKACLYLAQEGESGRISDIHDAFCTGWSHSLIIDKGLAFAMSAKHAMKENDHLISPAANSINDSVQLALRELADKTGHDSGSGPQMTRLSSFPPDDAPKLRRRGALQLKTKKTLPHHLLLTHDTAAFVGLTHDSLAAVFAKALSEEPRRRWEGIYIFYIADGLMDNFATWSDENDTPKKDETVQIDYLHQRKEASQKELNELLCDRTEELQFYEITRHCSFFGSFFGWRAPGGYIHVSPSIWGVDVKQCPSQGYQWPLDGEPSHEFNAYRRGIENLLSDASPFATSLQVSLGIDMDTDNE